MAIVIEFFFSKVPHTSNHIFSFIPTKTTTLFKLNQTSDCD